MQMWAQSREISSHMWITLLGVQIQKQRNSSRVTERKAMMMVLAPLLRLPVTAFTAAGMVGTGRGVGVVGGGTIQLLLSAFITVPIWQMHSITGSSLVLCSVMHFANLGHWWVRQGSGQLVWFHSSGYSG